MQLGRGTLPRGLKLNVLFLKLGGAGYISISYNTIILYNFSTPEIFQNKFFEMDNLIVPNAFEAGIKEVNNRPKST